MPRVQFKAPEPPPAPPERSVKFVSSGSTLLDLVLGGGWAQGRVCNIVGDKSAGKTLLAIEAMINFALLLKAMNVSLDHIHYEEAESAFDEDYATLLGMPHGISRGSDVRTVEDFERELVKFLGRLSGRAPSLYILDSLDALSDEAEMGRDIGDASYGGAKAKKLSELFRKRVSELQAKNCTLMVISQIRDNIGVTFGETKKRSGGKALDFYASQVMWLAEVGKLKRTVSGVERVTGVKVQARTKKMKVGPPFREAEVSILFNYGVDDEESMINWLAKYKALAGESTDKEIRASIAKARKERDRPELTAISDMLREMTRDKWQAVEAALMPPMSKYGS
jgi:recombination protein RecA